MVWMYRMVCWLATEPKWDMNGAQPGRVSLWDSTQGRVNLQKRQVATHICRSQAWPECSKGHKQKHWQLKGNTQGGSEELDVACPALEATHSTTGFTHNENTCMFCFLVHTYLHCLRKSESHFHMFAHTNSCFYTFTIKKKLRYSFTTLHTH